MFESSFCSKSIAVAALEPAAAVNKPTNSLTMGGEQRSKSMHAAFTPSQAVSVLPIVSNASSITANGSLLPSSSSLPSDVLARIEANKQAALQRRRAAEDFAKLHQQDGGGSHAVLPDALELGRQPALDQPLQSVLQSGANERKQSAKRHWGSLGAVADEDE